MISPNLSPHHKHGSGLAFSPLLRQFVTPCDNPDKDGLITAALLTLPGAPPLLVASVYAPAGEVWRGKVENSLRPLLKQFPSFLLGADFNCLIHPALDSQGLPSDNHWPWIRHSATATPPLLGDTYRLANPTSREFTRYPQGHRTSSSRLDYIFISPASLEKMSLLDACIHSENRATDHHPSSCTLSVPPTLFHSSTITKRVFRKLNKSEISTFNDALKEMSHWCQSFTPLIKSTPIATVQKNTSMVIRELSAQYHNTTAPRIKPDSHAVKSIRQAVNDVPPPTHLLFSAQWHNRTMQSDNGMTLTTNPNSQKYTGASSKKEHQENTQRSGKPNRTRSSLVIGPKDRKLTCDTKRLTKISSNTLLTLGGPLHYEPSAHTAEKLLQHTPQCPLTTAITPRPEISWHSLTSYLHSCKPSKAVGGDSTNGYLFHISPEPVKRFLLSVCNLHLTNDMPDEWLEANVVLLYKKGPTHDPVNYRPITLLNTLYRIAATHAAKHLYEISSFYGLIHKTQFRGLPNRRCSDHIFQLLAKYQNCPASYSLYIDFNKAFNSVLHGSLFKTLEHYRLPSPLIRPIRGLYQAPRDYPVVNGHTGASHLQTRGVRQGCPLSPILFVLYVNVLLFAVPHHLSTPITQHESSHACLLYRSESSQHIEVILSFYDSKGRAWGLDINLSKTKLHSMGKAPQTTITALSGKRLSTIDPKTVAPRKVYKYLGVYLFTDPDPTLTYELAKSEITSFSTFLHPLKLTPSEYI